MKSAQTRQVRAAGVPEVTRACVRKRRLRYAGVAGERDRRLRWRGERFGGGTAAPSHTSTGTARARTSSAAPFRLRRVVPVLPTTRTVDDGSTAGFVQALTPCCGGHDDDAFGLD